MFVPLVLRGLFFPLHQEVIGTTEFRVEKGSNRKKEMANIAATPPTFHQRGNKLAALFLFIQGSGYGKFQTFFRLNFMKLTQISPEIFI